MARILVHGGESKELLFNYRERAQIWDVPEFREKYGYTVLTAPADEDGMVTLSCVNRRAVPRGHGIRTGLEDTPVLPDGRHAHDNADLVAAAVAILGL
jgi:uncharacterized protein (DUF849 family)